MNIDAEKSIMKDKAKREYKKLLNPEIEVHSESESARDDDEEGSKIQEMSDLGPSNDAIEEAKDDDASNSDFESEKDDISGSEEVDEEKMNTSFQEIWDSGTQKLTKQIKEIEVLSYEKEEAKKDENNQEDDEEEDVEIDTVEEEY